MALDGALAVRDVEAMVAALVREGCVGETLGAAEVRRLAVDADPALAPGLGAAAVLDEHRREAFATVVRPVLHALLAAA